MLLSSLIVVSNGPVVVSLLDDIRNDVGGEEEGVEAAPPASLWLSAVNAMAIDHRSKGD